MPPGSKSHLGCAQCKRRKVKCDEGTPSCSACNRRGETCSYLEVKLSHVQQSSAPIRPHLQRAYSSPGGNTNHGANHSTLLDVELTHFFLTKTCPTLLFTKRRLELWCDRVFPLGFSLPALLDGHLATAAMHKAAEAPTPQYRSHYLAIALEKQAASLSTFIHMLNEPCPQNASGLFALSALVIVWAFASKSLSLQLNVMQMLSAEVPQDDEAEYNNNTRSHLADIVVIARVSGGIRTIVHQFRQWLKEDQLGPMVEPPELPLPPIEESLAALQHLCRFLEASQRCTKDHVHDDCKGTHDPYLEEIQRTEHVLRLRSNRAGSESIIGWLVGLSPRFIEALASAEPGALALLSFWSACFHDLDGTWWARGWGRSLVLEIYATLEGPWQHHLEWPMKLISEAR